MKLLSILLLLLISSNCLNGQSVFLLGNGQINNLLDEKTFPSAIDFHFSTKLSIGVQLPIIYDSLEEKERASLEIGAGTLFSSLYYENALRDNPRSDLNINDLFGLFLNIEPRYNLWQNKKKNLFLQASLNNILYVIGDYYTETIFLKNDSSEVTLRTEDAKFKYQYSLEPYIGVSYRLKIKSGSSYLFRIKSGYIIHNLPIAIMNLSDSNEVSSIKFNNFSWVCSVGFKITSN